MFFILADALIFFCNEFKKDGTIDSKMSFKDGGQAGMN